MHLRLTTPKSRHRFSVMPKPIRRITEKRRIYEGEGTGKLLTNWLNYADDEEGKKRINQVIALYLELWTLCRKSEASIWTKVGGDEWVKNETPEARKRNELETSLNRLLGYYQTRPWIYTEPWFERVDGHWQSVRVPLQKFSSRPVSGSDFDQRTKTWKKAHPFQGLSKSDPARMPGSQMPETGAIRHTLALIESGHIFNLRQCRCGKFIFQRFSHQRFCSQKCRLAEYRSSEEFRVSRNARQRELYQLHKKSNVK